MKSVSSREEHFYRAIPIKAEIITVVDPDSLSADLSRYSAVNLTDSHH